MKLNMAVLYQIGNDGSRARRWEIDEEPIVVGRSGMARVSIKDEGLSRRHFLIVREDGGYVIKDLNSLNGTWLDGHRVFEEKLRHNDRILAGHTQFVFAEQAGLPTTAGDRIGPHGTVVISAAPRSERSFSESPLWQRDSRNESQALLKPPGEN